jgi:hypothetical protein
MTAPVGSGLMGWGRAIPFIRIHRALRGTDMTKALRIWKDWPGLSPLY